MKKIIICLLAWGGFTCSSAMKNFDPLTIKNALCVKLQEFCLNKSGENRKKSKILNQIFSLSENVPIEEEGEFLKQCKEILEKIKKLNE